MKTLFSVVFCVLFLLISGFSQAADFGAALGIMGASKPPDALSASRGNTWVADPEGSSNNPACIAAGESFKVSGSQNFSATFFKHGPTVYVYDTSLYVTTPFGGVIQFTVGNTQSRYAATRMDDDFIRFDHVPYFDIAYGRQIGESLLRDGDKLFVGVGSGMNWFKMGFKSQGQQSFISRSRGLSLYAGVLYQPSENLNLGVMYAWSRNWCEDRDIGNGISSRYASVIHQVRTGVSWTALPKFGTTLAVDVQYLSLGRVNRIQAFAGVEQQIIKDRLYAYAGWAGSGPTAGLGLYFKYGGINVTYQNNPYADLNLHLGRSQTVMATIFCQF